MAGPESSASELAASTGGRPFPDAPPRDAGSGASPLRFMAVVLGLAAGLIVLATVGILLLGGAGAREYPANTPEGSVQGYVRALDAMDTGGAYALLSSRMKAQLSASQFTDQVTMYSGYAPQESRAVRLDRTDVTGDAVVVHLTIDRYYNGGVLTPGRYSTTATVRLVREQGAWRLDGLYAGPDLMPIIAPAPAAP